MPIALAQPPEGGGKTARMVIVYITQQDWNELEEPDGPNATATVGGAEIALVADGLVGYRSARAPQ